MFTFIAAVQIAAICILVAEALYVAQQSPSRIQVELIVLSVSTIVMMVGYLIEMTAPCGEVALTGCYVSYLGKPFSLLTTFLFAAEYCRVKIGKKLMLGLSVYAGILSAIVFTNGWHHLYYSSVEYDMSRGFSCLVLGHGPLYYLYMATMVVTLVAVLIMAVREYRIAKETAERQQVFYIFGMLLAAMIGYGLYLAGVTNGYDSTMFGCFVGALFLLVLFGKYELFNALSQAKEQALKGAYSGLLVLDERQNITYTNKVTDKLLNGTLTLNELIDLPDGRTVLEKKDRVFSVRKQAVTDSGRLYGHTIELIDITDSYTYSQRLERDVQARVEELQHMQRKVIASFSDIVDARDSSTGEHIKRIGEFAQIAIDNLRKNGVYTDILTDEYVTHLLDAAPLHDIGKISIPDSILLKPDRLTPEEYEVIKTHARLGEGIVEQTVRGVESDKYVDMAKEVALCHHEKWDGSGYPGGLWGENIPLCARIVAVADVYDALRSPRCYKPAMEKEEARRIISESSGTHLDPKIVDAFLQGLENTDL